MRNKEIVGNSGGSQYTDFQDISDPNAYGVASSSKVTNTSQDVAQASVATSTTNVGAGNNSTMEHKIRALVPPGADLSPLQQTVKRLNATIEKLRTDILSERMPDRRFPEVHKRTMTVDQVRHALREINIAINPNETGQPADQFSNENFAQFARLIPYLDSDELATKDKKVMAIRLGDAVVSAELARLGGPNNRSELVNTMAQSIIEMYNNRNLDPTRARHKPNFGHASDRVISTAIETTAGYAAVTSTLYVSFPILLSAAGVKAYVNQEKTSNRAINWLVDTLAQIPGKDISDPTILACAELLRNSPPGKHTKRLEKALNEQLTPTQLRTFNVERYKGFLPATEGTLGKLTQNLDKALNPALTPTQQHAFNVEVCRQPRENKALTAFAEDVVETSGIEGEQLR